MEAEHLFHARSQRYQPLSAVAPPGDTYSSSDESEELGSSGPGQSFGMITLYLGTSASSTAADLQSGHLSARGGSRFQTRCSQFPQYRMPL